MNRPQEDGHYTFHPPKYSRFWAPVIHFVSDVFKLRRANRVVGVKISSGGQELREMVQRGDSVLITPNHSDHCDPHVLMHLSRVYKVPIHFMAARELFDRSKGLQGPIFQRAGVFSIDREGSDLQSIKMAMKILFEAQYPLVMFPEGEIYHLHEKLTPLNEGAAVLGLRTAKKLKKEKRDTRMFIIPTALQYNYVDDVSSTFSDRMARLEARILWKPQNGMDIIDRIYKFGEALLSLKEQEHLGRTLDGALDDRLTTFRDTLISREEERYFKEVAAGNHPSRVRRLRGKIRSILLDDSPPDEATRQQCYDSLDSLYVAVQLYSYPGQYLREKPSMDRIAETIHKFEEDLLEENRIYGRRSVSVTFCEPVDAMEHLASYAEDAKQTVSDVTALIESRMKAVLEAP